MEKPLLRELQKFRSDRYQFTVIMPNLNYGTSNLDNGTQNGTQDEIQEQVGKLLLSNPKITRKPDKGMPICPEWLLPEAKAEWKRLSENLNQMGVLMKVDMAVAVFALTPSARTRIMAAAIARYLLHADNEPSAEVYGAAADRQQASIVFDVARQMVEMSPALMNEKPNFQDDSYGGDITKNIMSWVELQ